MSMTAVNTRLEVLYDGDLTLSVTLPRAVSSYDALVVCFETDWQWHTREVGVIFDKSGVNVTMMGFATGTTMQVANCSANGSGSTLSMGAERFVNLFSSNSQVHWANTSQPHIHIRKVIGVTYT